MEGESGPSVTGGRLPGPFLLPGVAAARSAEGQRATGRPHHRA